MRTTLTIDQDVAMSIHDRMTQTGRSFKETVNELLRTGLASTDSGGSTPVVVRTYDLGSAPAAVNFDKAVDLASGLSDADFIGSELAARSARRK